MRSSKPTTAQSRSAELREVGSKYPSRRLAKQLPANLHDDMVLPPPQAGLFISTSPDTLRSWRDNHVGPAWVRIGPRRVGYIVRDLKAWIEQQRMMPGA